MTRSGKLPSPTTPLASCLNLHDIEKVAQQTLKPKSWAYYHSSADDSLAMERNRSVYSQIRFRPRALKPVAQVDTSTYILGYKSNYPFFISPAAMGSACDEEWIVVGSSGLGRELNLALIAWYHSASSELAHEDGEIALVKGAARAGIPYGCSTAASVSPLDIAAAGSEDQTLFFQLYMLKDKQRVEMVLGIAKAIGFKAILFTVDAPVPGKRELDLRTGLDENTIVLDESAGQVGEKKSAIAESSQLLTANLTWDLIAWIKEKSGLPVVVKGIQSYEDAVQCEKYGAAAIMLSNHGGRQLDTASTPIETLLEIRRYAPHLLTSSMQIIVDSGIRRGTDAVIALCLGADAVSLGRPFMYSLCYGEEGVARCAEILGEEIARAMRLLGVRSVRELDKSLVNTTKVERLLFAEGNVKLKL
ncbi:BZ3500_MvSof-1268-A1-R1_Chr2-1g04456 [Microbotryum saponariae]|uniref:BZ3500_MvSof-1268-A1-R1_Chr2-1g04456 protein n=1 Tax=Microbotryum saponariae TaxID=289078 RepID=A0A2X0MC73_9BASI|nr:BZ3500_MvSof-1268-A1-R1_Chr2-1g04456 [Microbotryum saponariae]SCZ91760.1 BZ3501_MvSof-1269-A2-R1_Chr2-1g04112 [Microbotryum saponariae]